MADTPRVTVPVEPEYTATEYLRLIAEGWEVIESTGSQMTIQNPEDDGPQELVIDVDLLSAAPAPEGGEVDWSYDLTLCPRNEPFLIAYDDGDVRMGHYLDNSKSSVPWEGIRPLFVAERWDAKIVAWAKRPALATREEAPADHHERNLSMTNDELIEQALSSPPLEAPAEAGEPVETGNGPLYDLVAFLRPEFREETKLHLARRTSDLLRAQLPARSGEGQ